MTTDELFNKACQEFLAAKEKLDIEYSAFQKKYKEVVVEISQGKGEKQ